jgi:stage V sporulation protein D (sporulation-specific penicillin-binding protein)
MAIPKMSDRVLGVGIFLGLLYAALAFRLFHLQIIRHEEFVAAAEDKREKTYTLPARRGVLLDRNGSLLVHNQPAFDITIDPNLWYASVKPNIPGENPDARREDTVARLDALMTEVDVAALVAKRGVVKGKTGRYRTIEVAQRVSPKVADSIKEQQKKGYLLGVGIRPTTKRVALSGDFAPHVLGFTNRDGQGADGLEHRLNEALDGEQGRLVGEFDNWGRAIPGAIKLNEPARHGRDVMLTLDADIQHTTQEALYQQFVKSKAEAATAIVLDPKTGDILALANYPAFNVNERKVTRPDAWANRAVTSPYEPGSTLKTMTIAAALEDKKVTPYSTFFCNGSQKIGKYTIRCSHGERHGTETTVDVLRHSCNLASADCAKLIGRRRLYEYEEAFGFGHRTEAGLPGESAGLLANPSDWSDIQLANIGFGQGISVTPLQLVAAYGAIANDGVWMRPRIVWGERLQGTEEKKPQDLEEGRRVVSKETARQVQAMLQAVVDRGTGKMAQLDGYTAGGKTGTAQIAARGGYSGKYVASFIGMAPMKNPQFVVLVAVTAPQGEYYGGTIAAPVFKEITEQALLLRRVSHDKAIVKGKKSRAHDKHSLAD